MIKVLLIESKVGNSVYYNEFDPKVVAEAVMRKDIKIQENLYVNLTGISEMSFIH